MWVELVLQKVSSILKKSNKKQPNQRKTELKYNRYEEVCFLNQHLILFKILNKESIALFANLYIR